MNVIIKPGIYCLLILTLMSCRNKEGRLTLTVLNQQIQSYVPKDTIDYRIAIDRHTYSDKGKNIIKYKFENNSDTTYLLISDYPWMFYNNELDGMPYYRFIITDENGKKAKLGNSFSENSKEYNKYLNYKNELNKDFYHNLGYDDKPSLWYIKNQIFSKRMIIIHPNETLYFEDYVFFPQAYNENINNSDSVIFNYDLDYTLKLIFHYSSFEDISDYLTDSQMKTIEENNYKVYNGSLESENQIPIKFVK